MKKTKSIDSNGQTKRTLIPSPPDPGESFVIFLSWLKKRDCVKKLKICFLKWKQRESLEKIIKEFDNNLIQICWRRGEKVVWLKNKVWADQWMIHYEVEVPHHSQKLRTGRFISVTEIKEKD
jgi:hypothetical protein